jgi:hypothetical protein
MKLTVTFENSVNVPKNSIYTLVGFEFLIVMLLMFELFWNVTLCCWVSSSQCFQGLYCPHPHGQTVLVPEEKALQSFNMSEATHPILQHVRSTSSNPSTCQKQLAQSFNMSEATHPILQHVRSNSPNDTVSHPQRLQT